MKTLMLVLFASTSLMASCRPAQVISRLRPGTEFYMPDSNNPRKVKWLKGSAKNITNSEYNAAMAACENDEKVRTKVKEQARIDLKTPTSTDAAKIKAIMALLDLDK